MLKTLTVFVFVAFAPMAALAESYATRIADGAPWTTTAPNGGKMRMTLNPDGTGRMKLGIMSRAITWTEKDNAICLGGMPGGAARCVTFRPIEGGFAGTGTDGMTLVLRR
jgi:hypothetical protein